MFSQLFNVEYLRSLLLALPAIVIAISFHEFGHAWMANRLGDPTPRNQGRVTISPFAHIDPWGFLMLVLFHFGYGKPVYINPANFKNRKRDEILVALSGVTINLVISLVAAVLFNLLAYVFHFYNMTILTIVDLIVIININILIFNLLPIPPLDGYKVVRNLFLHKNLNFFWKVDQYGFLILLGVLMADRLLLNNFLIGCLMAVTGVIYNGVYAIAGIFF